MSKAAPEAYLETRVTVPQEHVDAVCDFIIVNIVSGLVLEEEDGASETGIIFYVPEDDHHSVARLSEYLGRLIEADGSAVPKIRQRRVENVEWLEEYRRSIRPVRVGDRIVVRPAWCEPQEVPYEIIIDPKMAFGTGSHATTQGCLLAMDENFKKGMTFLDMGTGSGILSILADRMGAVRMKAVDYDEVAVENCRENFRINGVKTPCEIALGSIENCDGDAPYDFVVANIIKTTILSMLDRLLELTLPGGVLVLAGLLDQDESAITAALRKADQDDFSIRRDGQWFTYTVRRR